MLSGPFLPSSSNTSILEEKDYNLKFFLSLLELEVFISTVELGLSKQEIIPVGIEGVLDKITTKYFLICILSPS